MASFVSIKSTIPQSAPQFIQEDHPIFIQFVEAYFEYLEQKDGPIDFVRNALSYVDPSVAMDSFINQFFEEMKLIPNNALADKNLLAQHIYDLYQAKGTIKSFELFFRLMFNEDVQIYFPKDDLLRVSDGKWNRSVRIRSTIIQGDIYSIIGNKIVQYSDLNQVIASANVESVQGLEETPYYDIFLNPDSIIGSFDINRELVFGDIRLAPQLAPVFDISSGRGSGYVAGDRVIAYQGTGLMARVDSILGGGIDKVIILNGGTGHSVGEKFNIISETGSGADIRVSSVDSGIVTGVKIVSAGQGYQTFPILTLSNGTFIGTGSNIGAIGNFKIEDPGYGHTTPPDLSIDTTAIISGYSGSFLNGESLTVLSERFILETGEDILSEDSFAINTEEQSAESFNISIFPQTDNTAKISGIIQKLNIATEDSFSVLMEDGSKIVSENSSGSIFQRTIVGSGSLTKSRILYINPANLDDTLSVIYDAGSKFINVDGNVSEITKRIQDSRYYQEFSYVIKSSQSISTYRNAIYSLLHPAGLALFGSIDIESRISLIVSAFNGLGSIVSKILESYVKAESILAKNVLTLVSEVKLPTHLIHDYNWLEQNKFIFGPHSGMVVGNKLTPLRYISSSILDIDKNKTLQIKDVGYLTFEKFYNYEFDKVLYIAPGYMIPDYVGISEAMGDYFSHLWGLDYYSIDNAKLNIGWDSEIDIIPWTSMITEIGDLLVTEDSLDYLYT